MRPKRWSTVFVLAFALVLLNLIWLPFGSLAANHTDSTAVLTDNGKLSAFQGNGKKSRQTPTPTPTSSATAIATNTPTPTPTATASPAATDTATPVATETPSLNSADTPTPTTTNTPTPSTQVAGVPVYPIDYSADAEAWWANHPLNPENPGSVPVGGIISPQPVVNVKTQFAGNIQNAIDALPATGGTLFFDAGTYNNTFLLTKSNVHFIGATGAVLSGGGAQVAATQLATRYADFAKAVWLRDPAAIQAVTSGRIKNIYFSNLTFDGNGSATQALSLAAANGVVFDNVTFRNYYDPATAHNGLVNGTSVLENIWFRGVNFTGNQRWALYLDGAHGSGVINSRIDYSFGSGGLLFLTNDDMTRDYNGNGTSEPDEKRISNYTVVYGNTFGGAGTRASQWTNASISGANSVVKNNRVLRPVDSAFVTFQGKASASNTTMHYDFTGNRVIGNQISANVRLYFANMDGNPENATSTSTLTFADYQVRDNALTNITSMGSLIREYGTWIDPRVATGNTVNGQPNNTIPNGTNPTTTATATPVVTTTPAVTSTPVATATPTSTPTYVPTVAPNQSTSFPIGMFEDANMLGGNQANFGAMIDDIKARGMNSVMFTNGYAARDAGMLSVSDAKGVDVHIGAAYELARQWFPSTISTSQIIATQVIQPIVNLYSPHPSHKGYYVIDEPTLDQKDKTAMATQTFESLDPTGNAFPVLIGLDRIGPIFTASRPDTMVLDVYPAALQNAPGDFTMRGFGYNMDMVDYIRQGIQSKGSAPLWVVLQTHGNVAGLRHPTAPELRTQAFLSIGEGAKGIFWFIYSSQQGWIGLKDNPTLYNEVTSLNNRMNKLAPTLLTLQKTADAFTATSSARTYVSTMSDGQNNYVIVVNRDALNPASVTVTSALQGALQNLETNAIYNQGSPITLAAGDGAMFKLVPSTQLTATPTTTSSTPTATSTPVASPTPTSTSTPMPTPTTTTGTTSAGVPVYPVNYNADVETWWASHPLNPENPKSVPVGGITSPQPVVNVQTQFGGNIQNAINALPATGGTLYFPAGTYSNSFVLTKSNVHFIGATGAVLRGGNGQIAASQLALNYTQFSLAVFNRDPAAIYAATAGRIKNIYFNNIIFDGGGSAYSAFYLSAANGVLLDNVTFRNFNDPGTGHRGLFYDGTVSENIWVRNSHFAGNERWALYLDGVHGSGVINSRIDYNFGSGGLLYLTNDDFTRDYNNNGIFEPNERRISNYIVLYGNTFGAAGSLGSQYLNMALTSANTLIKNNTVVRPVSLALAQFSVKASYVNTSMTYYYTGNRVVGNRIQANLGGYLAEFNATISGGAANSTAVLGQYQVRDNILTNVSSIKALVRQIASVISPNVITGNTVNGQPYNTMIQQ